MRVSPAGRAAIRLREGCRLSAYQDSRGIWTIGVGHVDMTPPVARPGMRITLAQADAMLAADLGPVEEAIASSVTVPLSQNQCDALASLAFNIGVNGFRKSLVVARINRGDYRGAADAFMLWSKPSVLIGRRRAEKGQFLTPDPAQDPVLTRAKPMPAGTSKPGSAADPKLPDAKPTPSLLDRLAPMAPTPAAAPPAPPLPEPKPSLLTRIAFFFGRH